MNADQHRIISAGRTEAAKMKAAVADADAEAQVTMNARQFGILASLVEGLCEIASETVSGDLGDPRYWVPLEEYAKVKRQAQRLAAELVPLDLAFGGGEYSAPN